MENEIISAAKEYIETLFAGNADGHDAAHSLRVYRNALEIAAACPECDLLAVSLAALLHDADDPKLFRTENNANARAFLDRYSLPQKEAVIEAVNSVSFSKNPASAPASPEARIVRDADRLDAMGAVGIARTFAYGGRHGRSLEDSVRHFYEKLLLLEDTLCTPRARELARERHEFLLLYLARLRAETGIGEEAAE